MSTLECIVACHPVLTYLCVWQFLAENHLTETLLDAMGMARLVLPSSVAHMSCSPRSSFPIAGPPQLSIRVQKQVPVVFDFLLMHAFLALQGLGVSEEAVLQLTANTNPFIAQGSLAELTAGQGAPGPILAAGAAKLQPPHVARLHHRYPLGRGGHVEVGSAAACRQALSQVPATQERPCGGGLSRRMSSGSPTRTHWAGVAMLNWV